MKQKETQVAVSNDKLLRAHATKIKKWVETVKELQTEKITLVIPITRLTSIKSLCSDSGAAEHFALYMAKIVQKMINGASRYESITPEEWEIHQNLIADAITAMEHYLETLNDEGKKSLWVFSRRICELQGDNFRRIHGTNIHFVKSGYLLKLDYAISCFTGHNFPYYAYKLAREYTELYKPEYGTGLIPESAPKLLEIAEFWCQYYFGQNLKEKFPTLMVISQSQNFIKE